MSIVQHDVLPDSRARTIRGRVFRGAQAWVPIFCANCGKEGGLTPEDSTFLFWMCDPCFQSKGHITGTMVVPDHEFYQKLREEQLESHGRPLSPAELQQVLQDGTTPLATLLKEAR